MLRCTVFAPAGLAGAALSLEGVSAAGDCPAGASGSGLRNTISGGACPASGLAFSADAGVVAAGVLR
jgi:hypothetical protein